MTQYPFSFPETLRESLPTAGPDGVRYADVKYRDRWDGILVIDAEYRCVGVYVRRRVEQPQLPFAADEIQEFRAPCLLNKTLASLPAWFAIWDASLIGILLVSPCILGLSSITSPWVCLAVFPIFAVSFVGMYSSPGFPLIRLPVAILGLFQVLVAARAILAAIW